METPRRMPLQDLPLEQFRIPGIVTGSITPRKYKRSLSPSRTTTLNPAKRRFLDAGGISPLSSVPTSSRLYPAILSNMPTVTPTRPSRLGNGHSRKYGRSQGTESPLPSRRYLPSSELYPQPRIESSTDPQSRHYPGFDVLRDDERRRSPAPRVNPPSDGVTLVDRSEEDKENVPLKRRVKKLSSKRRLLSGPDGSDLSNPTTPAQTSKIIVHPERKPFSACQALR